MKRKFIIIGIGLFGICALLLAIDHMAGLKPLKEALRVGSVPTALLNNGKLGKILNENNLVKTVPNDYSRYKVNMMLDRPVGQAYTSPRQAVAQPTGWTEATGEAYSPFDAWLISILHEQGETDEYGNRFSGPAIGKDPP